MSNIVFLIGNGFDVGMGLPTQYRDFYELYTNPKSDYYPKGDSPLEKTIFQDFASTIDANKAHWSYYEKRIGEYARRFSGKEKDAAETYVKQHEDFQHHFYEYLATQANTSDYSLLYTDPNDRTADKHHMILALKKILRTNYMCKVCKTCATGTSNDPQTCKKCKNRQSCAKCANSSRLRKSKNSRNCEHCQKCADAEGRSTGKGNAPARYLPCKQCQTQSEHYSNSIPNQPLINLLKEGGHSCKFLCFNYSTVLDKCLESLKNLGFNKVSDSGNTYVTVPKENLGTENDLSVCLDVCHVHGKITKSKKTGKISYDGKPVMGVNDPNQIRCVDFSRNDYVISHLVKEQISSSPQYQKGKEILGKSDIIIIYGMSVGITDQCWWDLILKRMAEHPTCQLIVYVYDIEFHGASPNAKDDIRRDWLSKMYRSDEEPKLEIPSNRISFVINESVFGRNLKKYPLYLHEEDRQSANTITDPAANQAQ